jgi:type IV pilus assembly protein PilM
MPTPLLALDIGSYSVKMAQLAPGRPPKLEVLASTRTTPGTVRDGEVLDPLELAECIRELLAATGVRPGAQVITAVGGPRVNARAQSFPPMPTARLRQTVVWEAEKWMPPPIQDCVVEPQLVGERVTDEGRVQDVVVVAAPKSAVNSQVQAIESAGLRCVAVDVEAFALLRSLIYASQRTDLFVKTVAIVRLGDSYSDITIVRRGDYVLSRHLPVAGTTFTRAVGQGLSLNHAEAERKKEYNGVAVTEPELAGLSPEEREVSSVMMREMDDFTRELRLSINYYQTHYQDSAEPAAIDEVLLTGGSSMLRNVDTYLSRALGVPATVVNVFDSLAVDTREFDPRYVKLCAPSSSVAVGLALTPHLGQYQFAVDSSIFGVVMERRQRAG